MARLAAEAELTDAFVAAFLEDATSDPDRVMAESATIALLDHPALSESLLDPIQRALPTEWGAALTRLRERRLQLQIEADPTDLALWDRAVTSGSRRVHLWLLEQPGVPVESLRTLADRGATTAVRNRASEAFRVRSGT
jgi:hypothetical protein